MAVMSDQELIDTLVAAQESREVNSNIGLKMLLQIAAERIEELTT